MRVHRIERHLNRIEMETVFLRRLQHIQVNMRVLMAGKSDKANLARAFGIEKGFHGAMRREDAVGVVEADYFVVLEKIDMIDPQTLQRFVNLLRGFFFRAPIDLGHDESLRAVTVPERLTHPDLALPVVVIPGIVHEFQARIDGGANDLHSIGTGKLRLTDVRASQTDHRNFLSRAAKHARWDASGCGFSTLCCGHNNSRGKTSYDFPPIRVRHGEKRAALYQPLL